MPNRLVAFALALLLAPAAHGQDLEARVAEIFARSCTQAGCHAGPNPQMGMDLSPGQFFGSTVGVASAERPALLRVHPGRPDSSYLVMKIRGADGIIGMQMPFSGEKLAEDEVQLIERWIQALDAETSEARRQEAAEAPQTAYPFVGWKIVNLPTARALDRGSWLFLISHRFNPPLSAGYDALYGLDGSGIIYLSLGYAVTDVLLVALARSNAADNVELSARYRILQQGGARGAPLGLSAQAAVNWVTEAAEGERRLRGEALKFTGQLSLTREVAGLGLGLVPGLTLNAAEAVEGDDPLLTLGLGARVPLFKRRRSSFAFVGEWVPIVSGYTRTATFGNDIRFDSWGGGLEIDLGGHVFQVVLANSVGLTTDQYLRGGDLDVRDFFEGEARLGFNIFRVLNF